MEKIGTFKSLSARAAVGLTMRGPSPHRRLPIQAPTSDVLLDELTTEISGLIARRGGEGGERVMQLLLDLVDEGTLPNVVREPSLILPPHIAEADKEALQAQLERETVEEALQRVRATNSDALQRFHAQCGARCLTNVRSSSSSEGASAAGPEAKRDGAVEALASIIRGSRSAAQREARVERVAKMLEGNHWPAALRCEMWLHHLGAARELLPPSELLPPMPMLLGGLVEFSFQNDLELYRERADAEGGAAAAAPRRDAGGGGGEDPAASAKLKPRLTSQQQRHVVAILQVSEVDEALTAGSENLASCVGTAFALSKVVRPDASAETWAAVPRCAARLTKLKAATRRNAPGCGAILAAHIAHAAPELAAHLCDIGRNRVTEADGALLTTICASLAAPWLEASLVGFLSVDALLFVWSHALLRKGAGWGPVIEAMCWARRRGKRPRRSSARGVHCTSARSASRA